MCALTRVWVCVLVYVLCALTCENVLVSTNTRGRAHTRCHARTRVLNAAHCVLARRQPATATAAASRHGELASGICCAWTPSECIPGKSLLIQLATVNLMFANC